MLFKFLTILLGLVSHQDPHHAEQDPEFVSTPYGPQSLEEEAIARAALHGKHYGGDMVFSDNFNTSDGGIKDTRFRWPSLLGLVVVPFVIDQSAMGFRNVIYEGMEHFHKQTCIRFVPRTSQTDYIRIYYGNGCWSMIGRVTSEQPLSLGQGCQYVGSVLHQLGHAIGLLHEHQRSDRDNYIYVYPRNVVQGQVHNFDKTESWRELIFTEYDYDSIMHYGSYSSSRGPNRLKTMEAKNGHPLREPYDKKELTQSDLITIKYLYQC